MRRHGKGHHSHPLQMGESVQSPGMKEQEIKNFYLPLGLFKTSCVTTDVITPRVLQKTPEVSINKRDEYMGATCPQNPPFDAYSLSPKLVPYLKDHQVCLSQNQNYITGKSAEESGLNDSLLSAWFFLLR